MQIGASPRGFGRRVVNVYITSTYHTTLSRYGPTYGRFDFKIKIKYRDEI